MVKKSSFGKISVPKGALPTDKELIVAGIIVNKGYNVSFIPVGELHSPDVHFDGKDWEIKSPEGNSSKTINNIIRRALHQSPNIIIDLQFIKIPEEKAIRDIKTQISLTKSIKHLWIVTKKRKIIELL